MPPKKDNASKKSEQKKKEKIIEDKTFGLKNKKGTKNQKFIAQVEKQVKSGGDPRNRKLEEQRLAEKKAKDDAKREEEEKRLLYRPVHSQQVDKGVDPKSVFCAFFKQGLCKKGNKCKFSHDWETERRSAKRNLYADSRDEANENMENWDDEKLAEVVKKKHGSEKQNQTNIICKNFLEAVENSKYGWFWVCPNGGDQCMYKHALPHGFVLKKDKKREEKKEEISIDELVESKRSELSSRADLTPVTLQTFIKWKKRKLTEKAEALKKKEDKKKEKAMTGFIHGLSGREMFSYNPAIAGDEEDEEGEEAFDMTNREDEESSGPMVKVHDIKFDQYGIMEDALDDSTEAQLAELNSSNVAGGAMVNPDLLKGVGEAEADIDEDLFNDEDLEELEEVLENLDL